MTDHPILFSGPMVRAILDGRKTQTRRVATKDTSTTAMRWVTEQPTVPADLPYTGWVKECGGSVLIPMRCPYGVPGDRLWVRETWSPVEADDMTDGIRFRADDAFVPIKNTRVAAERWVEAANNDHSGRWRPSIHMPRWASRLTLEVTDVRVERVQQIDGLDVLAEGIVARPPPDMGMPAMVDVIMYERAKHDFAALWDDINRKRGYGWGVNPWVWVVSFAVVDD